MPNEFDRSGMIHQWIYVIIPVSRGNSEYAYPLFCAFCKSCRSYFTEPMLYEGYTASEIDHDGAVISPSSLPKYGCEPPDDIPVI